MQRLSTILFAGAVLSLASVCAGQATQPAPHVASHQKVTVWTCESHEQFRMPMKGTCPVCNRDLVRRKVEAVGPYPLATCPVSGRELDDPQSIIVMMHEGREVRFCSPGCIDAFRANPDKILEQVDERIVEQQLAYYPMTTCPVSGEPLGSMGDPVNMVYDNRLVRFCCNGCIRGFKRSPGEFLAVLDAAVIEQQMPHYPLEACPISGESLGSMGEPVNIVAANRLVRFCCGGCVGMFYQAPAAHLATLKKKWADASPGKGQGQGKGKGHAHGHDDHDHGHAHGHDDDDHGHDHDNDDDHPH
jgi:YHS domain-containing protein